MLLQFRFSNFRSFRDEQTLSMVAGSFKDSAETVRHPLGVDEGVLPVAAVYGANASGKSNVILALEYMSRAVRNSHARWEPNAPIEAMPLPQAQVPLHLLQWTCSSVAPDTNTGSP